MREYIDEAIILHKRDTGHQDVRYSVFTERFGKMTAKATSARKITSKLAGHLEPGSVVSVRLIEQHGLVVVDALKSESIFQDPLSTQFALQDLVFLDRLLAEVEPEPFVWGIVRHGIFPWQKLLAILGWDPAGAVCSVCGAAPTVGFSVVRQDFFCSRCVGRSSRSEVVLW